MNPPVSGDMCLTNEDGALCFHVTHPDRHLDRCCTRITLVEDMACKGDGMRAIICKLSKRNARE